MIDIYIGEQNMLAWMLVRPGEGEELATDVSVWPLGNSGKTEQWAPAPGHVKLTTPCALWTLSKTSRRSRDPISSNS